MLGITFFDHFGGYILLMRKVFTKPQKPKLFFSNLILEIDKIGISSLWIVAFISVFIGAVATIQTAFNIDSPLIPLWT
ncbi:MAG: ABC transporter permease, partial [Bacteroidota bacterium]